MKLHLVDRNVILEPQKSLGYNQEPVSQQGVRVLDQLIHYL
jgi:hypothetical protein